MNFLRKAELLNEVVQEIAYSVIPKEWTRVVYYTERLRDKEIGLRKMETASCWVGDEMKPYTRDYCLKGSMELYRAVDILFEESEQHETWCGLLLTIEHTGKYLSKFYYEDTPMLDRNAEELAKRFVDLA